MYMAPKTSEIYAFLTHLVFWMPTFRHKSCFTFELYFLEIYLLGSMISYRVESRSHARWGRRRPRRQKRRTTSRSPQQESATATAKNSLRCSCSNADSVEEPKETFGLITCKAWLSIYHWRSTVPEYKSCGCGSRKNAFREERRQSKIAGLEKAQNFFEEAEEIRRGLVSECQASTKDRPLPKCDFEWIFEGFPSSTFCNFHWFSK